MKKGKREEAKKGRREKTLSSGRKYSELKIIDSSTKKV